MKPIQELISRIIWDKEFGKGSFVISYHDRFENKPVKVPFKSIHLSEERHFYFEVFDEDGVLHSIPYHRIREVYKDGILIWHRDKEE